MSNIVYLSNPNQPGFINSPDSLAYQAIMLNKNSFPAFHKQYGEGLSLAQMDFGTAFGINCAKYTIIKLAATPQPLKQLDSVLSIFAEVINELRDTEYTASVKALYHEIYDKLPDLFMHYNNYSVMKATLSQRIILILLDGIYGDIVKSRIVQSTFNNYAFH